MNNDLDCTTPSEDVFEFLRFADGGTCYDRQPSHGNLWRGTNPPVIKRTAQRGTTPPPHTRNDTLSGTTTNETLVREPRFSTCSNQAQHTQHCDASAKECWMLRHDDLPSRSRARFSLTSRLSANVKSERFAPRRPLRRDVTGMPPLQLRRDRRSLLNRVFERNRFRCERRRKLWQSAAPGSRADAERSLTFGETKVTAFRR